jgi:hypothetical protein
MAFVTIQNLTGEEVLLQDLYTKIAPHGSIKVERNTTDLPRMKTLQAAIAQDRVAVSLTYTPEEVASGLASPPNAVEAQDIAAVSALTPVSGVALIRYPFVAGEGAGADDLTVIAAGGLPFKFRVIDAWGYVSTLAAESAGESLLEIRTQADGNGMKLAELDCSSTGQKRWQGLLSTGVATPGSSEGLFVHRSAAGVAGELFLLVRPEI